MWIDSHCHLTHPKLLETVSTEEALAQARAAGIIGMLNISCRVRGDFPGILELAHGNPDIWCSVGTHPHDAADPDEKALEERDLAALAASDPKIVAVGESGLDYYYDNSPRAEQQDSFRKHIRACLEAGLPLVVHARDAEEDIIRILTEEGRGALRGVMHCFSGTADFASAALSLGFYVSFSGIITFKKAQALREVAASVPPDRVLVETDAPYLAPEPYRGKTNQPAYVCHTGRCLAEIHGVSEERMAALCNENFFRLFDRAGGAASA